MNLHPRDLLVPAIAQKVIFYREGKVCRTFPYLIMGSYPRFKDLVGPQPNSERSQNGGKNPRNQWKI